MRLRLRHAICLTLTFLAVSLSAPADPALKPAAQPTTKPVFLKNALDSLADLRALQAQVESVVAKVSPAVVGVRVNGGQGSGVIVSDDGYVLTAGHVSSKPNVDVIVILGDGKTVKAKTLGVNHAADSGLLKISDPPPSGGKWPFAEMGFSGQLHKAQWCIALGHPGGFKLGRTAPLRLGRILDLRGTSIRTDCTLVGGDSGGPLFDLDGRVIAIHSRIGATVNDNVHVPVDTFRDTWERLTKGEEWGKPLFASRGKPYFGVEEDDQAPNCRIGDVFPDSPAEKAGLKPGDVITAFGGHNIENFDQLVIQLALHRPGDELTVQILRDGMPTTLLVTIGRRPRG
jgi:serine protease Do